MNDSSISRELALRIGLAARVLPEVDVQGLLAVLERCVGLPLTADRLAGVKPRQLLRAGGEDWSEFDTRSLRQAAEILAGASVAVESELPPTVVYKEGDMPGSVRVAVATNGAEQVDGHFGSCPRFLIYQVDAAESRLIDIREAPDVTGIERNDARADLIADCHVLYLMSIGGPAAAKVVRRGIHPVKHPLGGPVGELLGVLRRVMANSPPPWLAKIMGQPPEQRIRFESSAGEA